MFQKTTFELDPKNALGSGSGYFGFAFGCPQEPKNGKIKLVQSYHSCREGLMTAMRSRITGANSFTQPTDKMRMIFRWAASSGNKGGDLKTIDGWVKRSVPVLQAFDKLAGWPLTRVYKIETGHDDWLRAYYFLSSRRWTKSSYMVSLYTMLVRMCKDTRITGFKDFNGLMKVMNKLIKKGNLASDYNYVKSSVPYWEAIMTGYPQLFRKHKIQYYWDTSRLGGSDSGYEGLQYLVQGDTRYKEVRKELLKIKKQLDSKKS